MKWFKHMSSLRNDPRIKRLVRKFGSDGYCVYVSAVEMIADSMEPTGKIIPYLEEDMIDLAQEFSIDSARVNDILDYCVAQNLFEESTNGMIFCFKLYNFVDEYFTKNQKNKEVYVNRNKQIITAYKMGGLPAMLPLLIELVPNSMALIGEIKLNTPELLQSKYLPTLDKLSQDRGEEKEKKEKIEKIDENTTNKSPIMETVIKNLADKKKVNKKPSSKKTIMNQKPNNDEW